MANDVCGFDRLLREDYNACARYKRILAISVDR